MALGHDFEPLADNLRELVRDLVIWSDFSDYIVVCEQKMPIFGSTKNASVVPFPHARIALGAK